MNTVAMSWPAYQAGCCRINGRLTRLTMEEAEVLCALLLHHPDRWASVADLLQTVWPNPFIQPDDAKGIVRTYVHLLRHRRGVKIESRYHWGYRIPRAARA